MNWTPLIAGIAIGTSVGLVFGVLLEVAAKLRDWKTRNSPK